MRSRRVSAGVSSVVVTLMVMLTVASGGPAAADESCEQAHDGAPCLVFSPSSGGPGTFVTFTGYVEREHVRLWKRYFGYRDLYGMYNDFPDGGPTGDACELSIGMDGFEVVLDSTTRKVSGSFTVGSSGSCRQEVRSYPAYPGNYSLFAGCLTCVFAEYRVTAATLPETGLDVPALVAIALGLCVTGGAATASARRRGRAALARETPYET